MALQRNISSPSSGSRSKASNKAARRRRVLLVCCLTYFSILEMDAVCSFEMSADFHWATRHSVCSLLHAGSRLALLFNPKRERMLSSETSVDFYLNIWSHIAEDRTFHNRLCENLKSHMDLLVP
jgi:hypothetical protein